MKAHLSILTLVLSLAVTCGFARSAQRPNLLYIFTDDQSVRTLSS